MEKEQEEGDADEWTVMAQFRLVLVPPAGETEPPSSALGLRAQGVEALSVQCGSTSMAGIVHYQVAGEFLAHQMIKWTDFDHCPDGTAEDCPFGSIWPEPADNLERDSSPPHQNILSARNWKPGGVSRVSTGKAYMAVSFVQLDGLGSTF